MWCWGVICSLLLGTVFCMSVVGGFLILFYKKRLNITQNLLFKGFLPALRIKTGRLRFNSGPHPRVWSNLPSLTSRNHFCIYSGAALKTTLAHLIPVHFFVPIASFFCSPPPRLFFSLWFGEHIVPHHILLYKDISSLLIGSIVKKRSFGGKIYKWPHSLDFFIT